MAIGVTFVILAVVVVAIWLIIEAKRLKHKVFAIFLIFLIIFTYVSFAVVIKNNENADLKTTSGWMNAGKLYLSWLGGIFQNVKSITAYAFKQEWGNVNESIIDEGPILEEGETIWDKIS